MSKNIQPQSIKPPSRIIFTLALVWPVLFAILLHIHLFDGLVMHMDATTRTIVTSIIALLPPAAVLLPLTYRVDFDGTQSSITGILRRAIVSFLVTSCLLWVLWNVFYYISAGLGA